MTQDNPISPMIFNIVLDEFVKMLLEVVCSPQEAQHSMGSVAGERNLVFYADDRTIVWREHEWVLNALVVTVDILFRMGLESNLKKTMAMVCTPRFIWVKSGLRAYK